MRHTMDHSYYVHPFWYFCKDHRGNIRFTTENSIGDDLPLCMEIPLHGMSQPLYRMLTQDNMFPHGSKYPVIIQQSYGDGYKVLRSIIFVAHPIFHLQPATLVTMYPKQLECSIPTYMSLFMDYLQLHAYIHNVAVSLDSDNKMDVFINNTKYNKVTREKHPCHPWPTSTWPTRSWKH